MKTGTPGTRPDSWRHTGTPSGSDTHGHPFRIRHTRAPLQAYRRAHGHPFRHTDGHTSRTGTPGTSGTRPDTWRHTRAPLQDQTHTRAPLAPVRTHGGTRAPLQAVRSGTLAPVRPPDQTHTGTPGTLQGTGGIFAPDPGGTGEGRRNHCGGGSRVR